MTKEGFDAINDRYYKAKKEREEALLEGVRDFMRKQALFQGEGSSSFYQYRIPKELQREYVFEFLGYDGVHRICEITMFANGDDLPWLDDSEGWSFSWDEFCNDNIITDMLAELVFA